MRRRFPHRRRPLKSVLEDMAPPSLTRPPWAPASGDRRLQESRPSEWPPTPRVEPARRTQPRRPSPSPKEILNIVNEVFADALIATEVGQNQMWAAQYLRFSGPRRWLTSGGLGTMGYGFPAALGAQAGKPDDRVVVIAGDGSFQMNIQELATCVQENLPVIVVILNNGYLGLVRQWQELFFEHRYSSTCLQARRGCPRGMRRPRTCQLRTHQLWAHRPSRLPALFTRTSRASPGPTELWATPRRPCPNSGLPPKPPELRDSLRSSIAV